LLLVTLLYGYNFTKSDPVCKAITVHLLRYYPSPSGFFGYSIYLTDVAYVLCD
jgi:hypothetical protein